MFRNPLPVLSCACLMLALAACGSNEVKDGPPGSGSVAIPGLPGDAVPKAEPRSRYGNGPVYEVFGKSYAVLDSSKNFKERGVASWYGKKFHGALTSMREPYDMYAMTAAHKTLPLPTYVRVRNLSNNKVVVVRINDRGPFVDDRIIDLSYAAARKLDIIQNGTSLVEIEAIGIDGPAGDRPTSNITAGAGTTDAAPALTGKSYVQVGAFGDRGNAGRQLKTLKRAGIGTAFIYQDKDSKPALYRVRIGPVRDVEQYDLLAEELARLGFENPYLVSE